MPDHIEANPGPKSYRYDEIRRLIKQYDRKLKIIHLNRQSLQRKQMSLKQPLSDFNDNTITSQSETWLDTTKDFNPLCIDSTKFVIFRCDGNATENKKTSVGNYAAYSKVV